MKTEVTLYEILEVSPHASSLVIKAAYRYLAQFNHPDKASGTAGSCERLLPTRPRGRLHFVH